MTRPRPIHNINREIRVKPDESEPSSSFEQESFLARREEQVEDEFHARLALNRRESGGNGTSGAGSFWRMSPEVKGAATTPTASNGLGTTAQTPSFSSAIRSQRKGQSMLGAALHSHQATNSAERHHSYTAASTQRKSSGDSDTLRHSDSAISTSSNGSRGGKKKELNKQRAAERQRKNDQNSAEVDVGRITDSEYAPFGPPNLAELSHISNLDRSSSDQSTGSLLYGKTPTSSALLGKSSSLIFPTGVESNGEEDTETAKLKERKVNLALDQCEAVRFPFKKKLILNNLGLAAADLPLRDLVGTSLGNSLHKLSLVGNRLGTIPAKLVQNLPVLKHLDLSQCELSQLPDQWYLPRLTKLNLSHNRFTDFPEETMLEGLPELSDLDMYGNKVAEITIPRNLKLLSKLEVLNLGYNDLVFIPPELDQLRSLKTLKVMNNFLANVPMRVCEMDLKTIDVSSNPVTEPPIETCERGICSMRRYWQCIRQEEQSKQKALDEVSKKVQRQKKKGAPKKNYDRSIFNKLGGPFKASPKASAIGAKKVADSISETSPLSASTPLATPRASAGTLGRSTRPKPPSYKSESALGMALPLNTLVKPRLQSNSSDEILEAPVEVEVDADMDVEFAEETPDNITVNDTLKVIFVGMAMVGKTSMIKRLIEGKDAVVPTHDERTVGVDIYEWEPKNDHRFEHIDSRLQFPDEELAKACGDVDVKFSVWDFAGQHVYHATHELFFSSRALYVLVWDMGATNRATHRKKMSIDEDSGAFKLSYDSSDDEEEEGPEDDDFAAEEEARRADRALERDIDEKVQFWVDCIQSTAPGAAILPVASFSDFFDRGSGEAEAKRRCNLLKQRLLKHEERRIQGIRDRLKEYYDQNRANDAAASRLRKLLCDYTRPKLIFGDDDENSVVRVSGTKYTGFDNLTERIVNIATGRYRGMWRFPIFHGHMGARIPRMRLQVRDEVRVMRDKFKVVEWGYFINQLRDKGLTSVEDISDALHFLTNTGELSYFGGVMTGKQQPDNPVKDGPGTCSMMVSEPGGLSSPSVRSKNGVFEDGKQEDEKKSTEDDMEDMDEMDDEQAILSIDDTSITAPSTDDGSFTTLEDMMSSGLSQFVFLNPRWLVAAVACILRHDLDREIKETRRLMSSGADSRLARAASFYEAHLNCPVITSDDACMLWQAKRITKKAAERALEYSNSITVTPFEFLQLLLIRFGVFVPIDLTIEKAFLGGKEYARLVDDLEAEVGAIPPERPAEVSVDESTGENNRMTPKFFFLPSLLGPCEPTDAWTYKNTDSWKTTLCHSVLFPDGVPPGLMERLTASVLSSIYAVAHRRDPLYMKDPVGKEIATYEGRLTVKEVLCWRTAFFVKLGTEVSTSDGSRKESIVEIFTHLADRESHLCVGSDYMGVGMRRLITSARGQVGDGGRKIWKGGYLLVCKSMQRVMEAYGGLEYEKQGFCPDCLSKKAVSEASSWEMTTIRSAVANSEETLRCQHGHRIDTRLVAGPLESLQKLRSDPFAHTAENGAADPIVPVKQLLRSVVVVGLWNGKTRKVVRVGSGFVVDRKRGLIVTASHTLMNIWGDRNSPFGENYYGLPQAKVVIGIIPDGKETEAVFRYFAKICTKDKSLDNGECHLDACVLRITTRLEQDVGGNGDTCGDQPEILLLNDDRKMKSEQLLALKVTDKCELDEQVRILGYNQGGEGLIGPGESLNRHFDFARGYVCMKFSSEEESTSNRRDRFKPRQEIVVICPTIGGHSGGPCVNQQGEVVGILSRADPAEKQRCYISPTSEWKHLIKEAKNKI